MRRVAKDVDVVELKRTEAADTVIVVEDEPLVRDLMRAILRTGGYQVVAAECASIALERLRDRDVRVDLLLTDVVMPRMNGVELVARVRELRPSIAVLYTSGYADAPERHGFDRAEFLAKPFSPPELLSAVSRLLLQARTDAPRLVAGHSHYR